MSITLINFAHPFTPEQLEQLKHLSGQEIDEIHDISVQFKPDEPFTAQTEKLLASVPLSAHDWQTRSIIINLPGLNHIAVSLLAMLHGLMGYFPTTIRLGPVSGLEVPKYEVKELLNLQNLRDKARANR